MKKYMITMATAIIAVLQGCTFSENETQNESSGSKYYNICLVIDGTDRLSEQNGVPQVSVKEIEELARMLSHNGMGTLYVSYVDKDCDNNKVAVFEWNQVKPSETGRKPDYMKSKDFKKKKHENDSIINAYDTQLQIAIDRFGYECTSITELAYSDFVAQQRKGSDMNGAINQAARMLQASDCDSSLSYIITVSDGCDNVGKELNPLPESMELLVVNSNVAKHQYGNLVSKEFVTLRQALIYIFK